MRADPTSMRLGLVVGLEAEAAVARRLGGSVRVAISGATAAGAARAAALLLGEGVTHLVSFGLAAGLDPALQAGTALVPDSVRAEGTVFACDPGLRALLGAGHAGCLLHSDTLVTRTADKAALFAATGCAALDMESGTLARAATAAGLPFAVLRAVCDTADRPLPPAARIPLRPDGRLRGGAIAVSILRHPAQLAGLIALGRDTTRAKATLAAHTQGLAKLLTGM